MYAAHPKDEEFSEKAREVLSINELYCHLGHVSHDRVRLLIKKELVEEVELDLNSEATICESCEQAKGEQKAIVKVKGVSQGSAIGNEIYSDL